MRDPSRELEILREKLENGERGGSEEDREALLEFDRQLKLARQECGEHRSLKLLRHCTRMSEEVGGLARALEEKAAAEEIVAWIQETYDNPETNRDYRVALRVFGARLSREGSPPSSIAWVGGSTPRNYKPRPDPAEMLDYEEDVQPMIQAAQNSRDRALIAVAFDAGLRPEELETLTLGQVSESDHGFRLSVDGKTGQRSVTLISSTPYLQRWLADHPTRDREDAPVWCKLSNGEAISYRMFLKIFKAAARRAEVEKPATPRNFRKSNATWLARRGATSALIEDRQGRRRGSAEVARYVAVFGAEDEERAYAKLHGREVPETGAPAQIAPVTCPRCHHDTPRNKDYCVHCQQVLSPEADARARGEVREVRRAVLKLTKEEPELLDEIEKATTLMELFEAHPELAKDVKAFTEALSGS